MLKNHNVLLNTFDPLRSWADLLSLHLGFYFCPIILFTSQSHCGVHKKSSPATPDFRETCPSFTLGGPSGRAHAVGLEANERDTTTLTSFTVRIQPTWPGSNRINSYLLGLQPTWFGVYNLKEYTYIYIAVSRALCWKEIINQFLEKDNFFHGKLSKAYK